MWTSLQSVPWTALVQIVILAAVFYYVFRFFRGTRGTQVLVGLILLLVLLIGLTHFFHLDAVNWLLRRFSVYFAVALLVIFQPEIRRALAEFGRHPPLIVSGERRTSLDNIVHAVLILSEHRVGALIAIERETGTRAIQETGIRLDARVTPELLASIFYPHTPLHDGAVIIEGGRIVAARCIFPLSPRTELYKDLGTRHRAGVGMSEETDAVVIVVSEETGVISICYRGRMSRGLSEDRLRRFLSHLMRAPRRESALQRVREGLDLTPRAIADADTLGEQEERSAP